MLIYLAPLLALIGTLAIGSIARIPMKWRALVAIAAGILINLFANKALDDGFQLLDLIDGAYIGLAAIGLYSGTKNTVQAVKEKVS